MLAHFGWTTVNAVIFQAVFLAGAMLIWLSLRNRAELVYLAHQPMQPLTA